MKIIFLTIFSLNFLLANTNLSINTTTIFDTNKKQAKINIANLAIGQSGIILHKNKTNKIIIAQASVISSNGNESTIKFSKKDILPQDAIPTSNLLPSNGDTFILNHLYSSSLLIVPNADSKQVVERKYTDQNFLNEDFFASYLKLNQQPIPKKEDFIDFCQTHQIGTIFMVIENKLHIVDSLSFKVIQTIPLTIESKETKVPFLTKIDEIESGFWDFEEENIEDYNEYYLQLLGIKK